MISDFKETYNKTYIVKLKSELNEELEHYQS